VLDPGMAGYSDLAADQDGHILCLYERGRVDNVATDPEHLTLARFNLEWLNQAARDDRELVPDSKPR